MSFRFFNQRRESKFKRRESNAKILEQKLKNSNQTTKTLLKSSNT